MKKPNIQEIANLVAHTLSLLLKDSIPTEADIIETIEKTDKNYEFCLSNEEK